MRALVWKEYMTRYPGLTKQPIRIRLPYHKGFDVRKATGSGMIREWIKKESRDGPNCCATMCATGTE